MEIQNEQRSFKYETFPDSQLSHTEQTKTAALHNNTHVSEPTYRKKIVFVGTAKDVMSLQASCQCLAPHERLCGPET